MQQFDQQLQLDDDQDLGLRADAAYIKQRFADEVSEATQDQESNDAQLMCAGCGGIAEAFSNGGNIVISLADQAAAAGGGSRYASFRRDLDAERIPLAPCSELPAPIAEENTRSTGKAQVIPPDCAKTSEPNSPSDEIIVSTSTCVTTPDEPSEIACPSELPPPTNGGNDATSRDQQAVTIRAEVEIISESDLAAEQTSNVTLPVLSTPQLAPTETKPDWNAPSFQVGDLIEAQFNGWAAFFPGVIVRGRSNGSFDIKYDDGELESFVLPQKIRARSLDDIIPRPQSPHPDEPPPRPQREQEETQRTPRTLEKHNEDAKSPPSQKSEAPCTLPPLNTTAKQTIVSPANGDSAAVVPALAIAIPTSPPTSATPRALAQLTTSTSRSAKMVDIPPKTSISSDASDDEDTDEGAGDSDLLQVANNLIRAAPSTAPSASTARRRPSKRVEQSPVRSARRSARLDTTVHKRTSYPAITAAQGTPRSARKGIAVEPITVSWKEVEEWKNVDTILRRKRRSVSNGQVEGTSVPWGEEFAAIQALKRFAAQYPDVLRDHMCVLDDRLGVEKHNSIAPLRMTDKCVVCSQCQLQVVLRTSSNSGHTARACTTTTAEARDALLLVKDLAFLLRKRLGRFLDLILPVVLPAVFHSHKRFLCETACEVLDAIVAHCSGRQLTLALLREATNAPRDDLRLVNLACLYTEKCLSTLSTKEIEQMMQRSARAILTALLTLLTCKSAACQISLHKCLLRLQEALGPEELDRLCEASLSEAALTSMRRHFAASFTAPNGAAASPYKQSVEDNHAADRHLITVSRSGSAGVSILQRMLAQRQNRVLPSP